MKRKAISGILGGLIMIIILVGSLSLLMFIEREESSLYLSQRSSISNSLEFSPIEEIYSSQGQPELVSSSGKTLTINYVIFPNGNVKREDLTIASTPVPVSSLAQGYNGWFIVVTNNGEEYNVSSCSLNLDPSHLQNTEVGITHAISLKMPYVIEEASSLAFHDTSGVQLVSQVINGTYYQGFSNVTMIYTFPENITFCVAMYFFKDGEPAPSPFGILLYTSGGYGTNVYHYYYEYFYAQNENDGVQLFWNSSYPVENSDYNHLNGSDYYDYEFNNMYRYTQIRDAITNGYLSVVLYKISLQDLGGTWYISIGSAGPGITYNESEPFQTSTYYPVGTEVPITSSTVYEVYLLAPSNAMIVTN
ncbi:hypothetical protein IC006_0521 [Sulfuracidifex tepidarius]|uniref:Uncharacterized protein n=1 Tax=Sulfuracidifex tepidarius TaxID=1294262 RepID=A0A510DSW5_9CREN|nr:hypothetical protein [Sulfuracidifex tepidarius]BBG23237.1 hypothetical protein IC006_0521 [Sulfuracidifex tepidarius]